jgi:hypothetical protein
VNGKMKNKAIQKFSPFALGIVVLSTQMAQGPMAYGASLNNAGAADESLLKPNVAELQSPSTPVAGAGCALAPTGSGSAPNSSTPAVSAKNLTSLDPLASSSVLASSATGSVVPSSVTNVLASDPVSASNISSNLVAQAPGLDDCCEIGGTTTCEIGGLPPVGGGALGGGLSPLAALAGLPLAALPFVFGGGGDNGTPPPVVPEASSTAAITAGLGLFGLWYGRRFRTSRKASS